MKTLLTLLASGGMSPVILFAMAGIGGIGLVIYWYVLRMAKIRATACALADTIVRYIACMRRFYEHEGEGHTFHIVLFLCTKTNKSISGDTRYIPKVWERIAYRKASLFDFVRGLVFFCSPSLTGYRKKDLRSDLERVWKAPLFSDGTLPNTATHPKHSLWLRLTIPLERDAQVTGALCYREYTQDTWQHAFSSTLYECLMRHTEVKFRIIHSRGNSSPRLESIVEELARFQPKS